MKQTLNLRLGQHLSLTPQLQQSLKFLQMSTLDLQQEIQQVLDSNMMLEIDDDSYSTESIEQKFDNDEFELASSDTAELNIPEELPIDSSWEEVYENALFTGNPETQANDFEPQNTNPDTLQEYLRWQLELAYFSERDKEIALSIIDDVNEEGYLMDSLANIFEGLQAQLENLDFEEVLAVLHHIQTFEPSGIAAENLADCLRIQLQQLPDSTLYKTQALKLVTEQLDALAAHDQTRLMRELQLTETQLSQVIALIRQLDPKPGEQIHESNYQYVIPDVYVSKHQGEWHVSLNQDVSPKLRINPYYSALIKKTNSSSDTTTMKNHLQEAKWFLKSLYNRNETLLRVARSIVEKQQDFLEHGSVAMRPMILKDIAEELNLHESTVSRVTSQKYMHTPNGIVEFKYFFSSHVSTETGGECSSTAIRAFIKELISNEDVSKPLSDDKIASLLKEKGINVARRTVAKYREAMSIAPSNQRKRVL